MADSARYQGRGQVTPTLVPASTILRVERETGNESLRGVATGGYMGLASAFGAVAMTHWLNKVGNLLILESSESKFDWGRASIFAAGGFVVGAGIGYHYGTGFKTYTRAYDDPSLRRP